LITSVGNRVSKISKGLKKLNTLKANAGHKKRKFYRKIGKSHIVSFFRDTFRSLKSCHAIPKPVRKAMTKAQKIFKKILWGKCKKGKSCQAFSAKKVGRVMQKVSALVKQSKSKKQSGKKSKKSSKKSKKNKKKSSKAKSKKKGSKKGKGNKRTKKIKPKKAKGIKKPFNHIASTLGKMLKGFMKKTGKKAFQKFKKSLKTSSKKLKKGC